MTTDWTSPRHPLWRWALFACAVATALPLWLVPYLPFTDLPQHVAMIATLRHWGDPLWSSPYELALGQTQYLLYYLLGALLAFPFGTAERANLILLSATALALPFALRSLLRALRADDRLALFAAPLFWSEALLVGFFNYLAALPVMLYCLALVVREATASSRRGQIALAISSVLLFYLHLTAFTFLGLAAAIALFWLPREATILERFRSLPSRGLWGVPAIVLVITWLATSQVVHPAAVGFRRPSEPTWQSPIEAIHTFPDALLDIWKGPQDEWCLLALLLCGALLAFPREQPAEEAAAIRLRGLVVLWSLLAVALFFVTPISIGWLWALNHRYAIIVALLAPALLRPPPGLRGALPLVGVALVAFFAAGTATAKCRAFNEEVGPFDEVMAKAAPGKRLLGLIYDRGSSVAKFAPFLHFHSYYRARHGGIAEFSFTELPQSPLRYKPGVVPAQRPLSWEWQPEWFHNPTEGAFYDYVLVRGVRDPFQRAPPGGPQWTLLSASGLWRLYGRK